MTNPKESKFVVGWRDANKNHKLKKPKDNLMLYVVFAITCLCIALVCLCVGYAINYLEIANNYYLIAK